MISRSSVVLVVLIIWGACADDPPEGTSKMSVSVDLDACGCEAERVELFLIKKNQSTGEACLRWPDQGDGGKSLSLKGVKRVADESYQVALAVYCNESTATSNGAEARGGAECCADLASCANETCNNPALPSKCQTCADALSQCDLSIPQIDLQEIDLEQLLPTLEQLCRSDESNQPACCQAIGSCMQAAWIGCNNDHCRSCAEAMKNCSENSEFFDPSRMEGIDLLMFILDSCTEGQNLCCGHSIQCIQESLSICDGVESCPRCLAAMTSCGGDLLPELPTPDSARTLYPQLCSGDDPAMSKEYLACYALESLDLTAGTVELKGLANSPDVPEEITQLMELPACLAE